MPKVASPLLDQQKGQESLADVARSSSREKLKNATASSWKPLTLGAGFRLDDAMDKAVNKVTHYMNANLAPEGLVVRLPQDGSGNAEERVIQVTERETERVLREYDTKNFLRLYATREKTNGVVVDGQV